MTHKPKSALRGKIALVAGATRGACVDHTEPVQVKKLMARIQQGHGGLDILVNDVWGGDALTEFGKTSSPLITRRRSCWGGAAPSSSRLPTAAAFTTGEISSTIW